MILTITIQPKIQAFWFEPNFSALTHILDIFKIILNIKFIYKKNMYYFVELWNQEVRTRFEKDIPH